MITICALSGPEADLDYLYWYMESAEISTYPISSTCIYNSHGDITKTQHGELPTRWTRDSVFAQKVYVGCSHTFPGESLGSR